MTKREIKPGQLIHEESFGIGLVIRCPAAAHADVFWFEAKIVDWMWIARLDLVVDIKEKKNV